VETLRRNEADAEKLIALMFGEKEVVLSPPRKEARGEKQPPALELRGPVRAAKV